MKDKNMKIYKQTHPALQVLSHLNYTISNNSNTDELG